MKTLLMNNMKYIAFLLFCFMTTALFGANTDDNVKRIMTQDTVEIFVWNNPDLSRDYKVLMDGNISIPLIGTVQAEGKTTDQLRDELTEKLKGFIKNPRVSVIISKHSQWVLYIFGEVSTPGEYDYYNNMKLLELVARAGGLPAASAKISKIKILRRVSSNQRKIIDFNLKKVLKGEKTDITLEMGDIVYIPKTGLGLWNLFVSDILPSLNFIGIIITLVAVL